MPKVDTSNMAKKPGNTDHIIKEVIEVKIHPDNMNREEGYCLSRS
jgi:hypothetical protein